MTITNRSGLPDALIKAIQNDSYDAGDSDFTATSLLKPARIVALERLHKHEIEEDAEDSLWRLYGQIAHSIIERANVNDISEKRFFSTFGKHKISAQIDTLCLHNGSLSDYKFTTAWGFKADSNPKQEWIAQLNIQLELLRRNGYNANTLCIVGLLRDWQISKAKEDQNYPQKPVVTLNIPMWSREQTTAFIEMRIAEHLKAREILPECSIEERWAKPDQWAVIKFGQKRAINGGVQFNKELALEISEMNSGTYVEYRPGESVRCKSYCSVSKFCVQYQASIINEKTKENI